jgi:hypothetical protein
LGRDQFAVAAVLHCNFAIGITVIQLVHFTVAEGSLGSFKVKVRLAYLLLLLIALPPVPHLIYGLPMIGTWALTAPVRGSILQRQ